MSVKLKYYILIVIIILSTMDKFYDQYLSTNIFGITVRYAHIIAIFFALILVKFIKIDRLLWLFIFSLIVSGIYNNSFMSAISLIFAILFSYYIFYAPALCFTIQNVNYGVRAILQSSRILMLTGIVLQLAGYTERMSAFFYEPAYMSIFLAAYASLCVTNSNLVKPFDYFLLIIFLYLSKSAAFILVILGIFFYLIFKSKKIIKLFLTLYMLLALYYFTLENNNLNYNIVEAYLSFDLNNIIKYSLQRTGERFNFFIVSLNEVMQSPLFGIGARAFQNSHNGIPPANIFFQIILESGLLGLTVCLIAIIKFFNSIKTLGMYKSFIACTSISLLITLQIESTYMRAYLWIFFGIFNGIILNNKKTNESI
jgi:hypothetical protein